MLLEPTSTPAPTPTPSPVDASKAVFGDDSKPALVPAPPPPKWTGAPVPGAAPGWEHLYADGKACGSPPVGAPVDADGRALPNDTSK